MQMLMLATSYSLRPQQLMQEHRVLRRYSPSEWGDKADALGFVRGGGGFFFFVCLVFFFSFISYFAALGTKPMCDHARQVSCTPGKHSATTQLQHLWMHVYSFFLVLALRADEEKYVWKKYSSCSDMASSSNMIQFLGQLFSNSSQGCFSCMKVLRKPFTYWI